MDSNKMLEFNKVKEKWLSFAITDNCREKIRNTSYILDETKLRKELRDTSDSKELIEKCGTPPLSSIDEASEIITIAQKEGCLTPYQLERIEKTLVTIQRLKDYLNRGKQRENHLAYYEENLHSHNELREEISRQIRGEKVDDYATKNLLRIRTDINNLEEKIKIKAEQIMRANRNYMADSYYTSRNGRLCIPVKKEYQRQIQGSVIDKSSTGSTLFIEPISVAKLQEELFSAHIDEENEVYQILYTLTSMVAESAQSICENMQLIEKLDYIFSKGKLSIDMGAIEPNINTKRIISLKNARHPLMDKEQCIPLQLNIGNGINGIIITGPNTGGKTVAIKTAALNCVMAQCGLHVTAQEADICMNSSYLCDIGDGQNITENLSTFSSHIKNVLEITEKIDKDSLVVMDELGSGTDPTEGMGIAISIIKELEKSGCLFLLTTHYPEVKDYAKKSKNVINARMEFNRETLKPTYRLIIGEAGESCAFYIAQKLGMSFSMLKNAIAAAYGEQEAEKFILSVNDKKKEAPVLQSQAHLKQYNPMHTKIKKAKEHKSSNLSEKFQIGDSVMVLPDKKTGIVCEKINAKGVLRVQLPDKKIYINHKRVRLQVPASELYPEDYDFSIIFDTVEQRKLHHDMQRKYIE